MRADHGMVWLDGDQPIPSAPDMRASGGAYRKAIVSLRRRPDGGVTATSLRYADDRNMPAGARSATATAGSAGVRVPRAAPRVRPAARRGDDATVWESAADSSPAPVATPAALFLATTTPAPPPKPALPVPAPPVAMPPGATPAPSGAPNMREPDPVPVAMVPPSNAKRLAAIAATGQPDATPAGGRTASASSRRATAQAVFTAASTVAPVAPAAPAEAAEATGIPPRQR